MTTIVLGGRPLTRAALPKGVKRKYIAITGTTPSRMQCPFDDPLWNPPNGEIWTIGPGGHDVTKWHGLIEIHGPTTWPETFATYLANMKTTQPPKRIFTLEALPEWPANVVMDRQSWFEEYDRGFVSSSIAYGLIQAFREGATDIGLWGIDLEAGEEYVAQAMGAKHLIALFRSHGVRFHFPPGCGLMNDPSPYPDRWEAHTALVIQSKLEQAQAMLPQLMMKHESTSTEIRHKEGWIAAIEGGMTKEQVPEIKAAMGKLQAELGQTAATINSMNGQVAALSFIRSRTMVGNPGE